MTRPQLNLEPDQAERDRLISEYQPYILEPEIVERMKPEAIILHPLPRSFELPKSVDTDPRAKYFEQAGNGLWVRMALLERIHTYRQSA
jgi:aspartate carbamoyltransferase catalytic subunit